MHEVEIAVGNIGAAEALNDRAQWEFLLATLIIFVVAVATISYQIVRAAKSNPVEVLKDE